jgi:hypothetical protein
VMLVSTRASLGLLLPAIPVHQVVLRQPLDRSPHRPAFVLPVAVAPTALRALSAMLVSTRAPVGLLLPAIPVHQVVPRQPLDRSPHRPVSVLPAAVALTALRALSATLVSTRAALGFLPRTSSFICFVENVFILLFLPLVVVVD